VLLIPLLATNLEFQASKLRLWAPVAQEKMRAGFIIENGVERGPAAAGQTRKSRSRSASALLSTSFRGGSLRMTAF